VPSWPVYRINDGPKVVRGRGVKCGGPASYQPWSRFAPRSLGAHPSRTLQITAVAPTSSWATSSTPPSTTARACPGRSSPISVSNSESVFYGGFVWARRALNGPFSGGLPPGQTSAAGRSPTPRSTASRKTGAYSLGRHCHFDRK